MMVTAENYHSLDANREYIGSSQYKDFCGSMGILGCEAKAMAKITGEWVEPPTPAMMVSSYVDAHFAGTLDVFKAKNHKIWRQDQELKAAYKHAQYIINRVERDEYFMKFMSGEKQVIFTAEWVGLKWKCMVDSYLKNIAIVDLKIMANLRKVFHGNDRNVVSFVEYYGYDLQAAIYQKVVEIATGERLPFFIAGASKEKPEPDLEIIGIPDRRIDEFLIEIENNAKRIGQLKRGEVEPDRCGSCDYCKFTKVLTKPISYEDLI